MKHNQICYYVERGFEGKLYVSYGMYEHEACKGDYYDCFFDGESCGASYAAYEVGQILGMPRMWLYKYPQIKKSNRLSYWRL